MLTNHSYQYSTCVKRFSPSHSIDETGFQHKNPLYRSKNFHKKTHKELQKIRKLSLTGSGDNFNPFNETWNDSSKRCGETDAKLAMILERLEINERQIAKLRNEKQKERRLQKQVKEIFWLVREQKQIQSKINEDHRKQLNQLKSNIYHLGQKLNTFFSSQISFSEAFSKLATLEQGLTAVKSQQSSIEIKVQSMNDLINMNKWRFLSEHLQASSKLCFSPVKIALTERVVDKDIALNEIIYYIDEKGSLLDENFYYMVDEKGEEVKACEQVMEKMRREGKFSFIASN